MVRTHKDLDVWRGAVELSEDIYRLTRLFPKEEIYGITSQMRRAAVSIASNIAEGAARRTDKDFSHFLYMAAGSASELDTQLEISKRLGMVDAVEIESISQKNDNVARMLQGLIKSVKRRGQ